jgi:hypothetical protein
MYRNGYTMHVHTAGVGVGEHLPNCRYIVKSDTPGIPASGFSPVRLVTD